MEGKDWHYDTAKDSELSFIDRLKECPHEPDPLVYAARITAAMVIRAALRAYNRFDIVGRNHLPRRGSFVLVANHASHLDAVALLSALPLQALHCAYPLNGFFSKDHSATFEKICAEHLHVIPAESYTSLAEADERLRAITFLQQRALAVEAEMRERVSAQRELQKREDELRDFVEKRIHHIRMKAQRLLAAGAQTVQRMRGIVYEFRAAGIGMIFENRVIGGQLRAHPGNRACTVIGANAKSLARSQRNTALSVGALSRRSSATHG